MDERITSAVVVLALSGLWLRSLWGPRWRDPGAREAGLGGGRGPSGVPGGAPRDRPRVCGGGIPRPCFPGGPAVPEVSPRAAASAGSRVPLPVCALFPARRPPILSSPRAAHRLDVGWWPRLGPNPAPPCWGRRRRPLVGPVSASPGARLRDRVGGAPRGARWASRRVSGGRPVARVRGKRGCRGTGRDCGGGGGSRGERRGPVGRSGCRAGPPSRSEAAGGETPACVSRPRSAAPEGSRGVPFPAGRLSRAFPVASASPVVPRLLPARSSEPGRRVPRVRLASRACRGPPWRRPSRASASGRARPPRVALPRSARACARPAVLMLELPAGARLSSF
nr:translation initiation factor IF-2-like [Pan troglodytes]